jgi:hypothetical protein
VQRLGIIGLLAQHLAIDFLGLGESTRLVILDGKLHRLIGCELGHPGFSAVFS